MSTKPQDKPPFSLTALWYWSGELSECIVKVPRNKLGFRLDQIDSKDLTRVDEAIAKTLDLEDSTKLLWYWLSYGGGGRSPRIIRQNLEDVVIAKANFIPFDFITADDTSFLYYEVWMVSKVRELHRQWKRHLKWAAEHVKDHLQFTDWSGANLQNLIHKFK